MTRPTPAPTSTPIRPQNKPDDDRTSTDLAGLLAAEPALAETLQAALASGRWMVTIHRKVRDAPPDDLAGVAFHRNFPVADIPDAMQALCRAVLADAGCAEDLQRWR
jgi:hypothetical protein